MANIFLILWKNNNNLWQTKANSGDTSPNKLKKKR